MKKMQFIITLLFLSCFSFNQTASLTTFECRLYSQGNDLLGSWNQILVAFDDNKNGKLDDEERKKGSTNKHYYQFNADGTCLVYTMKLKGSYELKNEDSKWRLYTYVDDNGTKVRENAWYLISVSKTELILLSQDKYAFWIFKRV